MSRFLLTSFLRPRFVASSNHLTALVLAHLAEVDARGAYRKWACDTRICAKCAGAVGIVSRPG